MSQPSQKSLRSEYINLASPNPTFFDFWAVCSTNQPHHPQKQREATHPSFLFIHQLPRSQVHSIRVLLTLGRLFEIAIFRSDLATFCFCARPQPHNTPQITHSTPAHRNPRLSGIVWESHPLHTHRLRLVAHQLEVAFTFEQWL